MPEIPLGNVVGPHFTPSVSTDGNLSWTNNGDLPNPATVNVKGPKGDTGTFSPEDLQRISALESGKVDKVSGKSLSTNDYTDADKNAVATIGDKVDKVSGKGLSTNDYTDADKAKVAAALTQHQDISGKVDKVSGKGLSTNDYTNADKNKLSGIPADANHTTIDTTLTNAGQAADAKTTGDSFSALHNLISRMEIYCTASGNPATFSDADAANVKALSVTITPTQSGSGTPSPSNIRPISGVSSVTVTRTGKNRVPFRVPTNNAGLTFSDNSGNGILVNGTATYDYNSYSGSNPNGIQFVTLNPGRYTLSLENDLPDGVFVSVVNDDTSLPINVYYPNGRRLLGMDSGVKTSGFTLQKTMAVGFWIYISRGTALSNYVLNPQLEAGYGATAREPYQGQTVTVTLTDGTNPLTVYGGTLDVTTGALSVTHANIASYNGETLPGRWISDRDVYASETTPTTGAQVVYELATPVTYNLTPQQLAALSGYNAVSSDAGTVSVTYKADTSIIFGGG